METKEAEKANAVKYLQQDDEYIQLDKSSKFAVLDLLFVLLLFLYYLVTLDLHQIPHKLSHRESENRRWLFAVFAGFGFFSVANWVIYLFALVFTKSEDPDKVASGKLWILYNLAIVIVVNVAYLVAVIPATDLQWPIFALPCLIYLVFKLGAVFSVFLGKGYEENGFFASEDESFISEEDEEPKPEPEKVKVDINENAV